MTRLLILLSIIVTASSFSRAQSTINETNTIILVRHAEKAFDEKGDPELTEEGQQRAIELARVLSEMDITDVFSTKFKRTMQTAKPIADSLSLEIKEYNPFKLEEIITSIKTEKGRTMLFVGHSNTVPMMLNLLTDSNSYKHIDESVYDNLYFVTIDATNNANVMHLKFGATSKVKTD